MRLNLKLPDLHLPLLLILEKVSNLICCGKEVFECIFNLAFSSIMFAFAGASTFPTIQADMKDKNQFPKAAVVAMLSKFHFTCVLNNQLFFSSVHDLCPNVCCWVGPIGR